MWLAICGVIGNVVIALLCHISVPLSFGIKRRQENKSRLIFGDEPHFSWVEVYRLLRCDLRGLAKRTVRRGEGHEGRATTV